MASKKNGKKAAATDELAELTRKLNARIEEFMMEVVSNIPHSKLDIEPDPDEKSGALISKASMDSAAVSGVLAMPAGMLALLSVLPDLIMVWKRQAQLVADIAAIYGKSVHLTREAMMYCLFKHVAGNAVRDLAVRAGQRVLVRKATLRLIEKIIERIAGKLSARIVERILARLVPILGAVGMAAYVYYDTDNVGRTAVQFFSKHRRSGGEKEEN